MSSEGSAGQVSSEDDGLYCVKGLFCTKCRADLNHTLYKSCSHPVLPVPLCLPCHEEVCGTDLANPKVPLSKLADICSWCGLGGTLYECDTKKCRRNFCSECMDNNLGAHFRQGLDATPEQSPWACLYCNQEALVPFHGGNFTEAMEQARVRSVYTTIPKDIVEASSSTSSSSSSTCTVSTEDLEAKVTMEILAAIEDGISEAHKSLDKEAYEAKVVEFAEELGADNREAVDEEVRAYTESVNEHLNILEHQRAQLQDSLQSLGISCQAFYEIRDNCAAEEGDDSVLPRGQWRALLESKEPVPIPFETGAMDVAPLLEVQEEVTDWSAFEEAFDHREKEDPHVLATRTATAAQDDDLEEYTIEPVPPHAYPPSFENVQPVRVLHALCHMKSKEHRRTVCKRYGVAERIELVTRFCKRRLPPIAEGYSFADAVHPSILRAIAVTENPQEQGELLKHYVGDSELGDVEDFGDTNDLYGVYCGKRKDEEYLELMQAAVEEEKSKEKQLFSKKQIRFRRKTCEQADEDAEKQEKEKVRRALGLRRHARNARNALRKQEKSAAPAETQINRKAKISASKTAVNTSSDDDAEAAARAIYENMGEGDADGEALLDVDSEPDSGSDSDADSISRPLPHFVKSKIRKDKGSHKDSQNKVRMKEAEVKTPSAVLPKVPPPEGTHGGGCILCNKTLSATWHHSGPKEKMKFLCVKCYREESSVTILDDRFEIDSDTNESDDFEAPSPTSNSKSFRSHHLSSPGPHSKTSGASQLSLAQRQQSLSTGCDYNELNEGYMAGGANEIEDRLVKEDVWDDGLSTASEGGEDLDVLKERAKKQKKAHKVKTAAKVKAKPKSTPRKGKFEVSKETRRANQYYIEVERRKQSYMLYDKDADPDGALLVNPKRPVGEPSVTVISNVSKHLKEHQKQAIQFMWNCVFASLEEVVENDNPGSGCIIAHCMGLGKTLSVISFCATLLTHKVMTHLRVYRYPSVDENATTTAKVVRVPLDTDLMEDSNKELLTSTRPLISSVLIIAPVNTLENWVQEFHKWTPAGLLQQLSVRKVDSNLPLAERVRHLRIWYEQGGVCIIGYDLFRKLATSNAKAAAAAKEYLLNPGPDMVVCDEAHVIRSNKSALNDTLKTIRTKRRVALTGSPMQNNLIEYHTMVDFVKPLHLGNLTEFKKRFAIPIKNGEAKDASREQKKKMKQRTFILHKRIKTIVDRKDFEVLRSQLQPKREFVLNVAMTSFQWALYARYIKARQSLATSGASESVQLLGAFQTLLRVWNHPATLTLHYYDSREEGSSKTKPTLDTIREDLAPVVAMQERRRSEGYDDDDASILGEILSPSCKKLLTQDDDDDDNDEEEEGVESDDDNMSCCATDELSEEESSNSTVTSSSDSSSGSDESGDENDDLVDSSSDKGDEKGLDPEKKKLKPLKKTETVRKAQDYGKENVVNVAGMKVEGEEEKDKEKDREVPIEVELTAEDDPEGSGDDKALLELTDYALGEMLDEGGDVAAKGEGGEVPEDDLSVGELADLGVEDFEASTVKIMRDQYESVGWYRCGVDEKGTKDKVGESEPEGFGGEGWLEKLGGKVIAFIHLLAMSVNEGDKVLLFSNSLSTLNFLEMVLNSDDWGSAHGLRSIVKGIEFSRWKNEDQYFRLDGSVSNRQSIIDRFNKKPRPRLMLLSTKAANMGINLYSANRIIIFDISWNPSNDLQAIYRAYRYGQEKSVFVYRLVAKGTMEEKIFRMSVNKQQLSARVVDAQMPENQFTSDEREHLFKFDPSAVDDDGGGGFNEFLEALKGSAAPDPVLEKLIQSPAGKKVLMSVADQAPMLEDKEEEHLNEAEQAEAEQDLENEVKGRVPIPLQVLQPDVYAALPRKHADVLMHGMLPNSSWGRQTSGIRPEAHMSATSSSSSVSIVNNPPVVVDLTDDTRSLLTSRRVAPGAVKRETQSNPQDEPLGKKNRTNMEAAIELLDGDQTSRENVPLDVGAQRQGARLSEYLRVLKLNQMRWYHNEILNWDVVKAVIKTRPTLQIMEECETLIEQSKKEISDRHNLEEKLERQYDEQIALPQVSQISDARLCRHLNERLKKVGDEEELFLAHRDMERKQWLATNFDIDVNSVERLLVSSKDQLLSARAQLARQNR